MLGVTVITQSFGCTYDVYTWLGCSECGSSGRSGTHLTCLAQAACRAVCNSHLLCCGAGLCGSARSKRVRCKAFSDAQHTQGITAHGSAARRGCCGRCCQLPLLSAAHTACLPGCFDVLQGAERVPTAPQGLPFDWHRRPAFQGRTLSQRMSAVTAGCSSDGAAAVGVNGT